MSKTERYVVFGAGGQTGAATARALLQAGKQVRVVVRDESKGKFWTEQGAELAIADHYDVAALRHALTGAEGAYLLSPPQYTREDLFEQAETMAGVIAEALSKTNVKKLVALSSIGAGQAFGTGWIAMNRMLEHYLTQTGVPVTFLRAAYFMENWKPLIELAAATDTLFSFLAPLERKLPMIATEDIGCIAAKALSEHWEGTRVIELEGPTAYSPNDVARCLSRVWNKTISASNIPEADWAQTLSTKGFSSAAIAGFTEMTQGLNSGHIAFGEKSDADHRRGAVSLDSFIAAVNQ